MDRFKDISDLFTTEDVSPERAQELKEELAIDIEKDNTPLAEALRAERRRLREEYHGSLSGLTGLVAQARELLGLGAEHDYQRMLKHLGTQNAIAKQVADKIAIAVKKSMGSLVQYRTDILESRRLFALNARIYTGKVASVRDAEEQLGQLEKESLLGSSLCTTKALELENRRFTAEGDIMALTTEQNELAMRIQTLEYSYQWQQNVLTNLQRAAQTYGRQVAVAGGKYQAALVHENVMAGIKDARSLKDLYMQLAVDVENLERMQKALARDDISAFPTRFRLATKEPPMANGASTPYWLTVADSILRPRYRRTA